METKARERPFSDYVPPMTPVGAIEPAAAVTNAKRIETVLLAVKALTIISALVAAVFVFGTVWPLYRDLPAEHKALRAGLDSARSDIRDMKTILGQSLCLQKAEKTRTDWRDCFISTGTIAVFPPRMP